MNCCVNHNYPRYLRSIVFVIYFLQVTLNGLCVFRRRNIPSWVFC